MVDNTIKTGVDDLLELLKKHDKMSLQEAAAELNMPVKILQTWVDFLIEEKVLSVEYKFTQPYIYINRAEKQEKQENERKIDSLKTLKKSFFERAKKKNIDEEQIKLLWKRKINIELDRHKDYFFRCANIKKLNNIPSLWDSFCEKIKEEL